MGSIQEITVQDFGAKVLQSAHPVLVDFYASWCMPCRFLAPMLMDLAPRYAGRIDFYAVDIDESPELANRYDVRGVPTMLLFLGGNAVDRLTGVPQESTLKEKLDRLATLAPKSG